MACVRTIPSLPTNGATQFAEQRGQWLKPPVPILSMRRNA
jgi:peptidyl-prolyl cis-trans isomerase A (cyclophilin A)